VITKAKSDRVGPADAIGISHRDYPREKAGDADRSPKSLHDIPAIARHLKVCEKTVRRLIASKKLRAHRIGRQFRVSEEDFITFLDASRRGDQPFVRPLIR
jgi:excisionase family DNA binding protein